MCCSFSSPQVQQKVVQSACTCLLLFFLVRIPLEAQQFARRASDDDMSWLESVALKKRLQYGVGLSLQTRLFLIEVSPMLGYVVHENYSVGLLLPYVYATSKSIYRQQVHSHHDHAYGISGFAQAIVRQWMLLYSDYGALSYASRTQRGQLQPRRWKAVLHLGVASLLP